MVLKKKNILYFVQFVSAVFIVCAYETSMMLSLIAALLCAVYCVWEKEDSKVVMLMLFLLPFSGVFKYRFNSTSLYMILRLACIARCFWKYKCVRRDFLLILTTFVVYALANMLINGQSGITRILNLILWFLASYAMIMFCNTERIGMIARSFTQGTVLSCVIGMNLNFFPHLRSLLQNQTYKSMESGEILSRFAGLWNDPNALTVMLVAALFLCFLAMQSYKMKVKEFILYSVMLTVFGLFTMSKSCIALMVVFWGYVFLKRTELKLRYKIAMILMMAVAFLLIYERLETLIGEILARFTSANDISELTTGRTDIWFMYFEDMTIKTWIIGNGVNCSLPGGRAAHNTILQVIYNVGIIGGILWLGVFVSLTNIIDTLWSGYKRNYIPILAIMSTMFFLDGFFLEYYYLLIIIMLFYSKEFSENKNKRMFDEL